MPKTLSRAQAQSMRSALLTAVAWLLIAVAPVFTGTLAAHAQQRSPGAVTPATPHQARGVVRARARATIASELVARVDRLPFPEGARFSRGDTLVAFDCRRYEAEQRGAEAVLSAARGTLKMNTLLNSHSALGSHELDISRARVEEARAALDSLAVRTSQCLIRAPFAGRVITRHIDPFEMPQANAPLLDIVDDVAPEIDVIVPSRWLIWLRPGALFNYDVDETGRSYPARIIRIAAAVDPISQTARITGIFAPARDAGPADGEDPNADAILPGMSGTATFRPTDADRTNGGEGDG